MMWTMNSVSCFCGMTYSFVGDDGICPRCGMMSSVKPESDEEMVEEYERWLATLPVDGDQRS